MPNYIQMLRLSTEGRMKALSDPDALIHAQNETSVRGIEVLGIYAVLGEFDFINIIEAPDNDTVARYSMELSVKAGAHITTLPAIPIARLNPRGGRAPWEVEIGSAVDPNAPPEGKDRP
ncbi:MAG: GYD domain-containing protein [SAR202 cluster bacterium]|nr:GYD domain-containing protein [SAR202 cluster bacterium]